MQIEIAKARDIRSRFLLNPISISIFAITILLYGWLDLGNLMPAATKGEWALATFAGGIFYFTCFYVFLPYLFSSRLTGHLPFFWQAMILISCVIVAETVCVFLLFSRETSILSVAYYVIVSLFSLTIGLLAFCFIFRANLNRLFDEDPIYAITRRFRAKDLDPLQALLPENMRGQVLQLEAQSPYLLVTTTVGSALIRMTIKQAMEFLDEKSGWLVHRSRWVHKSRIVELEREGRNNFFIDPEGNKFPISREMEKTIRAYLEFPQ
jgi:hypothetical protein